MIEKTVIGKQKGDDRVQEQVTHNIPPVYDATSRILILGSFPSVKSRETAFFYGHPQNRFWKIIASLYEEPLPKSVEEKRALLRRHHIAVWDVIARCTIQGSSDSSIQDVEPNDLSRILAGADIQQIYCNGGKSHELYRRYCEKVTGRSAIRLPSTSPANAAWQMERLLGEWRQILNTAEE